MAIASEYDIIVIGGGHAGAEAAWAAANLNASVALVTMDATKIGAMSCNPAIGGLAKGQMVREIDALGGLMSLAADATGIQFKILNASKGPAVQGPRCQSDKYRYARQVQKLLSHRSQITIIQGTVDQILVQSNRIQGVVVATSQNDQLTLLASAVVLTTGTFMRGLMHTGPSQTPGGRVGESSAINISSCLTQLGFQLGRLKTGTPPRLDARTINFSSLPLQQGDAIPTPFSSLTLMGTPWTSPTCDPAAFAPLYADIADRFPVLEQRPCWLTQTNPLIHQLIRDNKDRAPLYNGQIDSTGPRYCPSIEDKVFRFADKTTHHVFLEPEALDTDEIYCNGISTSLPADVQQQIIANLPGCEKAQILRYGYAVEYDMVPPHQIDATTMTKLLPGFFLAGQINGTSGYEEAAAQGLLAGLNAVRYIRDLPLIRLRRDQAYIGVMMDDLVTKTPQEPYRMFTSRAEYRLQLRADNASDRLTPLAHELGLIDPWRWSIFQSQATAKQLLLKTLQETSYQGTPLAQWIRRPEIQTDWVLARLHEHSDPALSCLVSHSSCGSESNSFSTSQKSRSVIDSAIAEIKYAGYLSRQEREIRKLTQLDQINLSPSFDYARITGLRTEARQTLTHFRPLTLGQASRLAGITPADVMLLTIALRR